MQSFILLAAGLATAAHAFTQPKDQTWGALLTPDTSNSVTQGKDFSVTWDPSSHATDGVTVSLVLCHGPGSNCVLSDSAIAEGLPASQKSFDWKVPCDLAPGKQSTSTGYGMLIIVDGTGEFQYSTQFSVLENDECASSDSPSSPPTSLPISGSASASLSATTTVPVSGGGSIVLGPPAYQTGSYTWATSGNWTTTTASPTASTWAELPGTTVIVSTSGSVVYTYDGNSWAAGATTTAAVTASTLSTVAAETTGVSATATGPAASTSPFAGGAAQLGSSLAGMVIAGAVAVFAL
ncbi:hypothetical protein G647_07738 [Cladophialophora carrionii CBS 160.54]|uniref:Yeast cell wall synthesis Kre9/Knh1-like N-terminal domain-containing protein n=1 Tax=Cladophialophora carrionii CBS 160.54 TaxID=1279043 RepID=V9D425_9EURO|nr:uncharacterized protein G647_07738 [Cladophialophora carrionii CBS 160.54]ETI21391.1 hypothetical protein G647_07738 [Cladophialophora carrionii CBS 160.54]